MLRMRAGAAADAEVVYADAVGLGREPAIS